MSREVIRTPTVEDTEALSSLFREVFAQERDPSVWRWKYFGRPEYASKVFEVGGRIVAHCGGVAVEVRDGAARYGALQSTDFMSSPNYAGGLAGGGVFVRTVRAFYAEYCESGRFPMLYGFPGERHRVLGERLLGYRPIELVGELRLAASDCGASLELEDIDEKILRFLTHAEFGFGAVRDCDYLRWRYVEHPRHRYQAVVLRGLLGRLRGALIVREDGDELFLFEMRLPQKESDVERLFDRAKKHGRTIRCWLPPSSADAERLMRHSFVKVDRDHYFETRFFNGRPAPRPGEFHYTLGDYDVY